MKEEQKIKEKALEKFKFNLDLAVKNIEILIKMAESADLENEQFFLDWLDKLNKLSVSH